MLRPTIFSIAQVLDDFQYLGPGGEHLLIDLLVGRDGHAEFELFGSHFAFLGSFAIITPSTSRPAPTLEADIRAAFDATHADFRTYYSQPRQPSAGGDPMPVRRSTTLLRRSGPFSRCCGLSCGVELGCTSSIRLPLYRHRVPAGPTLLPNLPERPITLSPQAGQATHQQRTRRKSADAEGGLTMLGHAINLPATHLERWRSG